MPLTEALRNIHFPTNPDVLRRAQYRLKFEELFYVQLNILRYAKDRQKRYRGYIFEKVGELITRDFHSDEPDKVTNEISVGLSMDISDGNGYCVSEQNEEEDT